MLDRSPSSASSVPDSPRSPGSRPPRSSKPPVGRADTSLPCLTQPVGRHHKELSKSPSATPTGRSPAISFDLLAPSSHTHKESLRLVQAPNEPQLQFPQRLTCHHHHQLHAPLSLRCLQLTRATPPSAPALCPALLQPYHQSRRSAVPGPYITTVACICRVSEIPPRDPPTSLYQRPHTASRLSKRSLRASSTALTHHCLSWPKPLPTASTWRPQRLCSALQSRAPTAHIQQIECPDSACPSRPLPMPAL